jgi:hypothetical protein
MNAVMPDFSHISHARENIPQAKVENITTLYSLLLQHKAWRQLCLDGLLLVVTEGKLREPANRFTLEVEHVGNSAAGQSKESEK